MSNWSDACTAYCLGGRVKIAYQNHHLFGSPSGLLIGELAPAPTREGYSVLLLPNGHQFSMQPGGVFGSRDPAVGEGNGQWEWCKRTGNILAFEVEGVPYGVLFMEL